MSWTHSECYLAQHGEMERGDPMPSCQGQLIKAHLIPRQVLTREMPGDQAQFAIEDGVTWRPACGGLMGVSGHHGLFDSSRRLRLPPEAIPSSLIGFAREHGLLWWLIREYKGSWNEFE